MCAYSWLVEYYARARAVQKRSTLTAGRLRDWRASGVKYERNRPPATTWRRRGFALTSPVGLAPLPPPWTTLKLVVFYRSS